MARSVDRVHHVDASAASVEHYIAVAKGKERKISAHSHISAGDELGTDLADEDVTGSDELAAKLFNPPIFGV